MDGGGIYIYLSNNSEVNSSIFTLNSAIVNGGGIAIINSNNSRVNSSTFTKNLAQNVAGGIYFQESIFSEVNLSTFTENSANNNGGGIYFNILCSSEISNTTFSRNIVIGSGTGESLVVLNNNSLSLNNITLLKKNSSKRGVAKTLGSTINITNSLFVCENVSDTMFNTMTGVNLLTGGNILYSAMSDPMMTKFSTSTNMFINTGLASTILNLTLVNNGGLTQTHALVSGSPAIDFSKPIATTVDQRGAPAVGVRDCGSFEFNGIVPPTP